MDGGGEGYERNLNISRQLIFIGKSPRDRYLVAMVLDTELHQLAQKHCALLRWQCLHIYVIIA
jgi:hypothetical protein